MQPATAGNVAARISLGGRPPMNALLATYLLLIVLGIFVIMILEDNDDFGGHA